jgi:hypothetical protein
MKQVTKKMPLSFACKKNLLEGSNWPKKVPNFIESLLLASRRFMLRIQKNIHML